VLNTCKSRRGEGVVHRYRCFRGEGGGFPVVNVMQCLGFVCGRGSCRPTAVNTGTREQLSASKEGLCCIELARAGYLVSNNVPLLLPV